MKNNKQYNRSQQVRLRMLIAVLVLGSLFGPTFAANRSVLSGAVKNKPHYFKEIPSLEYFQDWKKEVINLVKKYAAHKDYEQDKPEEYLRAWLEDLDTIENIIADKRAYNQDMDFAGLVKKYQVEEESLWKLLLWCAPALPAKQYALVSIGKLSPSNWVSIDAKFAVADELYRASMREKENFHSPSSQMLYNLCVAFVREEFGETHEMVQVLTYNSIKALKKSILSLFTGNTAQGDKDHKNN